MKHLIIAFFVLGQSIAFAQQKGATPSAGTQPSSSAGQTYAVVVDAATADGNAHIDAVQILPAR